MFAWVMTMYHNTCLGWKCSLLWPFTTICVWEGNVRFHDCVPQNVCGREMFAFILCITICVREGNVRFYDYMYNNNIMCVGGKCSLSWLCTTICVGGKCLLSWLCATICVWEGNVRFDDYIYNNNIMCLGGKCSLSWLYVPQWQLGRRDVSLDGYVNNHFDDCVP